MTRRIGVEAALMAPALAAGVGLGRLTTAPGAPRTVLPVLLCVVTGHAVVASVGSRPSGRRAAGWGAPAAAMGAPAAAMAALSLLCVWWFEPGATLWGLPTLSAAQGLTRLVARAAHLITSGPTPVQAVPGVVLCVAAGAGTTAVLARRLAGPDRDGVVSIGRGLVPTTGLFCYTALLSSGVGRVWGALSFAVAVALSVLVADRVHRPVRPAARRGTSLRSGALLAVALSVPLAASPALAGMRLDALPYARPGAVGDSTGSAGAQVPWLKAGADVAATGTPPAVPDGPSLSGLSLVDDLQSVLSGHSDQLLFTADTPVPTYWQVATLTRFDGRRWSVDPATSAVTRTGRTGGARALPDLLQPPGAFFSAAVEVVGLQTTLLPAPPGTQAVAAGSAPVNILPGIGVVTRKPSIPGLSYVVVGSLPGGSTASSPVASRAPAPTRPSLAPYLALPAVDRSVVALAHAIVRGASGQRAEALALAGWFHSGHFRYSLDAPTTGGDPLRSFLFHTRTGFCQQFAGAYAVLARLDGLPTRLAVGFTAGRRSSDGLYVVTGADAHVWPEVYLGPQSGWVSVEPTPATGDGGATPGVLFGVPPLRQSGHAGTLGQIRHAGSAFSSLAEVPAVAGQPAPARAARSHSPPGGAIGQMPRVMAALAGATLLLAWTRRRWLGVATDLAGRLRPPRAAVLSSWRRAGRELGQRHLGRAPHETMDEHAARLRAERPGVGRPYAALTELAARACYAAGPISPADALAARRLRARVCAAARRRRRPSSSEDQPSATTRRSPESYSSSARNAP